MMRMGRYVVQQRMEDLLGSGEYRLKHRINGTFTEYISESLVLIHVEEGWSEEVTLACRTRGPRPVLGDPPLQLYELLLNRIAARNIAKMRRILDGQE